MGEERREATDSGPKNLGTGEAGRDKKCIFFLYSYRSNKHTLFTESS